MMKRRLLNLAAAVSLAMAMLQTVALAGDCPIFRPGDWGVGEIDGRFILYLGKDHCLITPLHSGTRCLAVLVIGFAAECAVAAVWRDLTPAQARRLQDRVARGLRFLNKLLLSAKIFIVEVVHLVDGL